MGKSSVGATDKGSYADQMSCMKSCLDAGPTSCYGVDMVSGTGSSVECWHFTQPLTSSQPERTSPGIIHGQITVRCPTRKNVTS